MTSNPTGALRTMLVADLRCFRRGWRVCAAVMVVLAVYFGIVGGGTSAAFTLPLLGAFYTGYALFGCDENEGWFTWRRTLGATSRDIVRSHYLLVFAGIAAGAVLATLSFALAQAMPVLRGENLAVTDTPNVRIAALLITSGVAGTAVISSICFPLVARFGLKKGLVWMPVLVVFGTVAGGALVNAVVNQGFAAWLYRLVNAMVDSASWWLIDLAVAAATFALLALSGRLSARLYEKRRA
jgi:hypothetical protein